MIAAGTALPLMDVIFGKFINTFNDFAAGKTSPDKYMDDVRKYTFVIPDSPTV